MENWEFQNILNQSLEEASTRTVNQISYNQSQMNRPASGSTGLEPIGWIIGGIILFVGPFFMMGSGLFMMLLEYLSEMFF